MKRRKQKEAKSIRCTATNPEQWITLYEGGVVRLHVRHTDTHGHSAYRTMLWDPRRRTDREAIRRLIEHLNLMAAGHEGEKCTICLRSAGATGAGG